MDAAAVPPSALTGTAHSWLDRWDANIKRNYTGVAEVWARCMAPKGLDSDPALSVGTCIIASQTLSAAMTSLRPILDRCARESYSVVRPYIMRQSETLIDLLYKTRASLAHINSVAGLLLREKVDYVMEKWVATMVLLDTLMTLVSDDHRSKPSFARTVSLIAAATPKLPVARRKLT